MTATAAAHGTRRHRTLRRAVAPVTRLVGDPEAWAALFGLSAVAFAIPLFRVLGPNPEFFVAHGVTSGQVLVFAAVVGLGAPAALATLGTSLARRSFVLRAALVGVVGVVAWASLLQLLAGSRAFLPVCLLGGVLLAVFDYPGSVVRSILVAAAVVGLLAVCWFALLSRSADLVRASGDAEVAELVASGGGTPGAPVVLLVFDELPVAALLDEDLEVDEERFPAFARLAEQSDWFRNTSSASPQTAYSVPGIFSGTTPDAARLPVASEHPTSIFAQLGGSYDVHAREAITALCPTSVCTAEDEDEDGEDEHEGASREEADEAPPDLLEDVLVVLGHAVGDDALRDRLGPIDQGWGGFGAGALAAGAADDEDGAVPAAVGTYPLEADGARAWAEGCIAEEDPPLCVAHVVLPHGPWMANPDGSTYVSPEPAPGEQSGDGGVVWVGEEANRAQGYQRMLLQLGAVDRLLGELVATLEANGVWDDAAVAVTADHGLTFEAGRLRAGSDRDVTGVPLFIKAPGQQDGEVRDEAALTIDAVPTLLGLVGVQAPEAMDGVDLQDGDVPELRDGGFVGYDGASTPDQSEAALRAQVEAWARWVPPGEGWTVVYALGDEHDLVDTSVPEPTGAPAGRWRFVEGDATSGAVTVVALELDEALASVLAVADGRAVASQPGGDAGAHDRLLVLPVGVDPAGVALVGVDDAGALHPLTGP